MNITKFYLNLGGSMPISRLIEKWLPINEISVEAIRERAGAIPNPEPHQLHVWWARRPLVPSRAAVAGSLLPVDFDHESFIRLLGTYFEVQQDQLRLANARAHGRSEKIGYRNRRAFTHTPTRAQLKNIHKHSASLSSGEQPIVLDLTAGAALSHLRLAVWVSRPLPMN